VSTTLATRFAEFAHHLTPTDIPDAVLRRAAMHVLDTLAAGVAGSASREATRSRDALLDDSRSGATVVWGTKLRTTPASAALLNGIAAHAYELDDSGGCDHSGAVVVPAVLAAASAARSPVDGPQLLTATVLGYELGRRVQEALGGYDSVNESGWHTTGTCGPFAAAAAAAKVLGLDQQGTAHAIGLAAASAAGSWAFLAEGAMSKRLHAGHAARGGLEAALLAAAGFSGPSDIFEAAWGGFLDLYRGATTPQPGALLDDLGTDWQIEYASIKPHATCRSTHAAIDALLTLRSTIEAPETVNAIEVRTSDLIATMCGGADIDELSAAQLSLPFALAVATVYGRVDIDDVIAGQNDPRVTALIEHTTITVDPSQNGGSAPPDLDVHTTDGTVRTAHAQSPRGSRDNPLTLTEVVSKGRRLLTRRLPTSTAENLIASLTSPPIADAENIARLLVP
jgi:2-methylcitrate dehydratase PrpD